MDLNPNGRIVGIGSALMDILLHEEDDYLTRLGAAKGGMILVDKAFIVEALVATRQRPTLVPGGSACNAIVGAARLGSPARFVGKRGDDDLGVDLEAGLKLAGVEPMLNVSDTPTGNVLSIITPDAQRSMFTYLGASQEMGPDEVTVEALAGAAIVHIEGYLIFNRALLEASLKQAKAAGAKVSLDLASYTVVEAAQEFLKDLVASYVDILIANEDEARVYTGLSDEPAALEAMAGQVDVAVLKQGKRGSMIAAGGEVHDIAPAGQGQVRDTTAAGDLWAAGLLSGLLRGMPLDRCGALASACGWEVCQVDGAAITDEGWSRITNAFELSDGQHKPS